jgi:hypothetical protein
MVYQVEVAGIGEEHRAETMERMHQAQVEGQDIYIHRSVMELLPQEILILRHNHRIHCEVLREMVDQVLLALAMTDYFIWLFKSD